MKFVEITGKKFRLGSRFARLFAFFIDGMLLASVLTVSLLLLNTVRFPFDFALLSALLWILGPKTKLPTNVLVVTQVILVFLLGPLGNKSPNTLALSSIALWAAGMSLIDGFKNGQGLGKKLLSLQVLRLKDGKPCTFKDSFIRRLTSVFQPLDSLWTLGKNRQRMGDKFAETVVVKFETEPEQIEIETEDPEKILERAIVEMKSRLSDAREKVDASVGIEKQFHDAYEGMVAQAEQWQERAIISLNAGREDLAREDMGKRNEYRRLADQYKKQWEAQKKIVRDLSDLLEHLQQRTMEAERKKTVVTAQHRNIDAEVHLREMLKEIQDSKTFDTLVKTEQDATEAATLAKAAAEVDVAYQEMKLEREFSSYAEEASIDEDLAELKAKLQK